ncbi:MAG: hypothetical protein OEW64_13300, partial [Gammaproteobacteria bacterium]|nr:hypothetical protein [Gammaproteobacteria bacterium]
SGLGIDSSSGLGIDSSSGLGIDSSSGLGIDSSSGLGIDSSSGLGIDSSSGLSVSADHLVLAGPVDSVNVSEGIFMSLGQRVSAPGVTLAGLRLGDYVIVGGKISGAGTIQAHAVSRTGLQYTPGSSEVYVTGIPSSVDTRTGTAMIGELKVDYTPSLGGLGFEGIGAAITFIGTQPALGGIMISDRVLDKTELFLGR